MNSFDEGEQYLIPPEALDRNDYGNFRPQHEEEKATKPSKFISGEKVDVYMLGVTMFVALFG